MTTYHRDGIVDLGIGEEVRAKGFFLDFSGQHGSNFVSFVEQVPNLDENANKNHVRQIEDSKLNSSNKSYGSDTRQDNFISLKL